MRFDGDLREPYDPLKGRGVIISSDRCHEEHGVIENPTMTLSHIGICVSDLKRSERFYTEALGFVLSHSVQGGPPFDIVSELPNLNLHASFLKRDGVTIELLYHEHPPTIGSSERRPMNQLGFTHMVFALKEDMDTVIDGIVRCGGHAYPHTRLKNSMGDFMFCTDPDGTRIQLWRKIG